LEQSGLDHGPISVHEKMRDFGMTPVPSTAALARIFRDANVAQAEPRKKPRASYRRFVYPAPNARWHLDATDYVLTGGRTCVIFQLIDDHSRYAVASHVASGDAGARHRRGRRPPCERDPGSPGQGGAPWQRVVDDHMFAAGEGALRSATFRLQLYTAPGTRPVAVVVQSHGEGPSVFNAAERYAEAVWQRCCPTCVRVPAGKST
jgi:hypothetical protein